MCMLKMCFVGVEPSPGTEKYDSTSAQTCCAPAADFLLGGSLGTGSAKKSSESREFLILEEDVKKMLKMTPKGMPRGTLKS